jgi:hypothetical protein
MGSCAEAHLASIARSVRRNNIDVPSCARRRGGAPVYRAGSKRSGACQQPDCDRRGHRRDVWRAGLCESARAAGDRDERTPRREQYVPRVEIVGSAPACWHRGNRTSSAAGRATLHSVCNWSADNVSVWSPPPQIVSSATPTLTVIQLPLSERVAVFAIGRWLNPIFRDTGPWLVEHRKPV